MKKRLLSIFLALSIFTTSFSVSCIEVQATEKAEEIKKTVEVTDSVEEKKEELFKEDSVGEIHEVQAVKTPETTVNALQAGLNDFSERLAAECAITSVQFTDNIVYVSYHSNVPGFMQAYIYEESAVAGDDKNVACASSNRIAVEASNDAPGDVTVQLPVNNGTVPENFFTEVVFTDKDGEILNSYKDSSNKKSLRMLRAAAEPGSKDKDRIIYVDDTRESYLVLKDTFAIIKDGKSYSINFSDDTVTISGIPQALSGLTAEELSAVEGLVFMLEDAGDSSDFKIDSYTSGSYTTVSKNTKNFLPILVKDGESIGVDTINNSVSFKYIPASEMQAPEKIFEGGHFNVDEPILQGPPKFVVNFSENGGKVTGYVSPTVNPKGSIDWDWTDTAVNFGAEIYVQYDLTLSGATTDKRYEWGDVHDFGENSSVGGTVAALSIPLPPIFTIKVLLTLSALFNNIDETKGDAHVTGLNYYSFGVAIGGANVNKPKTSSRMQAQANPNQYIEITIDPQIALSGGIDYIFGSYDVITGNISMPLTARFKQNPDEDPCIHYCLVDPDNPKGCSEWGQNYTLEGVLTVTLKYLFGTKPIPSKLDEYTSPVTDSYYSQTYKDKGNGMCPHKGWPVEVTVKYPNGTLAAGATVNVPEYDTDASDKRIRNHSKGTTDKNGKLTIYIPAGDNRVIHAEKGKNKGETEAFSVAYASGEVIEKTIVLGEDYKVNVVWNDASNKDGKRPDSVALHMENKSAEGAEWTHDAPEVNVTVDGWENNRGSKTAEVFSAGEHRARLDAEVKEYTQQGEDGSNTTIQVVKLGDALYKVEYKDEGSKDDESVGSTTVTLTMMKEYHVEIKWDIDMEGNDHPNSVNVQLQKHSPLGALLWTKEEQIEVTKTGLWKGDFAPVPAYDSSGKEIKYRIREMTKIFGTDEEITVYDEKDKDIPAKVLDKLEMEKCTAKYEVDSYFSLTAGEEVSKHKTKYQPEYEADEDTNTTTITNLAVVDITGYKKWLMLGDDAEQPDSAYLLVQSRYDTKFAKEGESNPWLPVIRPVSGDTIKLFHVEGFIDGFEIPVAIGKVEEENKWKVSFRVKKYGETKQPLEFQVVEGVSGAIADVIQKAIGFQIPISINPLSGYVSTFLPKAISLLDETSLYSVVLNTKYSGSSNPGDSDKIISGMKIWKDNDNEAGKRPDSVTVYLKEDGKTVETYTLKEENQWSWIYENADKDKEYTVEEEPVDGYETSYDDLCIINTYKHTGEEPKKDNINIDVVNVWDDNDNADGVRPNTVVVELVENDTPTGKTLLLNEGNQWKGTFRNFPANKDGNAIEYSLKNISIKEYTTSIKGYGKRVYEIVNVHQFDTIDLEGEKTWEEDVPENRPESITIHLLANGTEVDSKTVKADSSGNWTWKFEDMPEKKDGKKIVYTVTEDAVENYSTKIDGMNITNTYNAGKTSVTVTKVWEDEDDRDGKRPAEVTVKLLANGSEEGKTLRLNKSNDWIDTFKELPIKDENGNDIKYSIEEGAVDKYTAKITGSQETGYTITNTHIVEKTSIEGTKHWDDNNDAAGKRPESITVRLFANGQEMRICKVTPNSDGEWKYKFENLSKYEDGKEIVYVVTEDAIENYTTTLEEDDDNADNDIKNTFASGKTSLTVTKKWQDDQDRDGIRPDTVTIKLLANGGDLDDIIDDMDGINDTINITKDDAWTDTFTDLPVLGKDGKKIEYSVSEEKVEGYTSEISGDMERGYTITNTHKVEKQTLEGEKTWVGDTEKDRPKSIKIRLLANGIEVDHKTVEADSSGNWAWKFEDMPVKKDDGHVITYTVTEDAIENYSATISGMNVTNTYSAGRTSFTVKKVWDDDNNRDRIRPNEVTVKLLANGSEEGKSLILSNTNNWNDTFRELPVKDNKGNDIEYTVKEVAIDGYTSVITGSQTAGYTITNTHSAEKISVEGTKHWLNDTEEVRPEKIIIRLLADGKKEGVCDVEENDAGEWKYKFENLPKYADGKEIVYTITEDAIENYTTRVANNDIYNEYAKDKTSLTVTKQWKDDQNRDGIRPDIVIIKLFADGNDTGQFIVLKEAGGWTGTFNKLPVYNTEGKKITYSVSEEKVEGYTSEVTGDKETGFIITNTHDAEKKTLEGAKTWEDENDVAGKRPESITIRLLANGVEVGSRLVKADSDGKWEWKFENMPVKKDGMEITYTITEDAIDNYSTVINGMNVTNTYNEGKTSLTVTKVWDDEDDRDRIRPDEVVVKLLENGSNKGMTLTLSKSNNWSDTFKNLPIKDSEDKDITYSIEEVPIKGYTAKITGSQEKGYLVTNTHEPKRITISGTKSWIDDAKSVRPEFITIRLYANGREVDKQIVTEAADGSWSWEFEDKPVYDNGLEIMYKISEDALQDYTSEIIDYDVTNTYTKGRTSVSVNTIWDDNNNKDGIRPNILVVTLFADGEDSGNTMTLAADTGWTGVFPRVPVFKMIKRVVFLLRLMRANNSDEIAYTLEADPIPGYTTTITGNSKEGFVITNKHRPSGTNLDPDPDPGPGPNPSQETLIVIPPSNPANLEEVSVKGRNGFPDTGDNSRMGLWLILLIANCVIVAVLLNKRKKEK